MKVIILEIPKRMKPLVWEADSETLRWIAFDKAQNLGDVNYTTHLIDRSDEEVLSYVTTSEGSETEVYSFSTVDELREFIKHYDGSKWIDVRITACAFMKGETAKAS